MAKTKYDISSSPNRWHPSLKGINFEADGNIDEFEGDQQGTLYLQRNNDGTTEFASRAWLMGPRPIVGHANPRILELTPQNAINVVALGADPSGRTGSAAAINLAIAKAKARGYGRVYVPAGFYLLDDTIVMEDLIWLHGDGKATILRAKDGLNKSMIKAYLDSGVRWGYMQYISDMRIDGNRYNQDDATGSTCHGIEWIAPDGSTAPILVDEQVGYPYETSLNYGGTWFDSWRGASNLFIQHCAGTGFYSSGRGGGSFDNIHVFQCQGDGIRPTYDTSWTNCTAGRCGKRGFLIEVSALHLTNCKAWYSGEEPPASGWNLYDSVGFSLYNSRGAVLTGCEAQDNYAHGFSFNAAVGHHCVNCVADSNNKRGGDSVGINFYDSYANTFEGFAYDRYANSTRYQDYALKFANSQGNTVRLKHMYYNGGASASATQSISHFHPDTDSMQGNDIRINNQDGMQKKSGASSPITVSPFHGGFVLCNLTTNMTVNPDTADTLIPDGAKLRFEFRQDATGARSVTWNSIFRVANWSPSGTANKLDIIEFTWNSELEKWVETFVNNDV